MSAHKPKPNIAGCRGWNYHVYAIGADCCSICGAPKWAASDSERNTDA